MKLKTLFLGSFALVSMLFVQGCSEKNDEPSGAPSIELSESTVEMAKEGGDKVLTVTATRDWKATSKADWIAVDPTSGKASDGANVTVTVLENTGMDRTGTVEFTIGFDSKTLTVNQKGSGAEKYTSISDVRAKGSGAKLGDNTVICGTVISNPELNNLTSKKIVILQDETAGIELYCAENSTLSRGDKVIVDLSGASLSEYAGLLQVNGIASDKITPVSGGNAIEAKSVSIEDFLANKYESQYVKLDDVQVVDADLNKTWVQGDAHSSINLVSKDGKSLIVRSSKYSSFKDEKVPQGSGSIKGIAAIFNSDLQLIFSDAADYAGLTGERFSTGSQESDGTVKSAIEAVVGSSVTISNVLVTGVTKQSFVASDATGNILVFAKADPGVKVGDKVNVTGSTQKYNGLIQISSPTTTPVSSGNAVTYPEPKTIDESNMETYSSDVVEYVSFKGNVVKSGNYYNIYVGSIKDKDFSLSYWTGDIASLEDKDIEVKGWFVGGSSHYQVVAVDVKESATSTPKFSVSAETLTAKADDTSVSFEVKGNVKWTVVSDNAAYTVSPASGEGAGTVKVSFAANAAASDVTVKFTVSTTADVDTKSYTVVLTHNGTATVVADYGSNIKWTLGTSAYESKVTINDDKKEYAALKFGTSSKVGDATMVIPAGTKKITFYAYAWKGKTASLAFKVGETAIGSAVELKANDGCTSNSPFALKNVKNADIYSIDVTALNGGKALSADVTITVESVKGSDPRAVIFAVNAEK